MIGIFYSLKIFQSKTKEYTWCKQTHKVELHMLKDAHNLNVNAIMMYCNTCDEWYLIDTRITSCQSDISH